MVGVSVQYCCEGRIGKERVCMRMCVCVCIQYQFCSYKHFTVCRVYLHGCMCSVVLQHSTLSSCAAIFLCCTKREDKRGLRLHKKRGKIALLLEATREKEERRKRQEKREGEKRAEKRHCRSQLPAARANVLVLLARCCLKERGRSHCLGRPKYMHTCWSTKPVLAILVSTCPLVVF